jgi:hypothetical protein
VVVLLDVEEVSYQEAAATMNRSLGTLRLRLCRSPENIRTTELTPPRMLHLSASSNRLLRRRLTSTWLPLAIVNR